MELATDEMIAELLTKPLLLIIKLLKNATMKQTAKPKKYKSGYLVTAMLNPKKRKYDVAPTFIGLRSGTS